MSDQIADFDEFRRRKAAGFEPHFETCERHGKWQANVLCGEQVRWLPSCPTCKREVELRRAMGRAALPERFSAVTLENYVIENPAQQRAVTICRRYLASFREKAMKTGASLIFSGTPGTGKSHLAGAIAHGVIGMGYTALYVTAGEIFRRIKKTYRKGSTEDESDIYESLAAVDFLVIDEIGVQKGTDFELEAMFSVINARYERCKPMMVLTNLLAESEDPKDTQTLEHYIGARAYDRLCEGGLVMLFDWESWRARAR